MTCLGRLWLTDFRCYEHVELTLDTGCTVVTGSNGQGKTSLLEAVAWLATGRSLRGVPDRVLVRTGADEAIVRAEISHADPDELIEAAIRRRGGTGSSPTSTPSPAAATSPSICA